MNTDLDTLLASATRKLVDRFNGVIDEETIGWYVADSYVALHRTAHADPRLPDLAGRFAADRLTALAQRTGRLPKAAPCRSSRWAWASASTTRCTCWP